MLAMEKCILNPRVNKHFYSISVSMYLLDNVIVLWMNFAVIIMIPAYGPKGDGISL